MIASILAYFLPELLVVCLVVALIFWVLGQFAIPDPIGKVICVILVVIVCLWLIFALLNFLPSGPHLFR